MSIAPSQWVSSSTGRRALVSARSAKKAVAFNIVTNTAKQSSQQKTAVPKRGASLRSTKTAPAAPPLSSKAFKITLPRKLFNGKQGGKVEIPVELGFTKSNELFVGRMAMIGFASSLLGEVLTGKGPLAQFDIETGINLFDTEWFVLALIGFNLLAAIAPAKGRFVADEPAEQSLSPEGSLNTFVPTGGFGFTKANEIFVGRLAQLGFAASLIGEVITGKGALAQFGIETGLPMSDTEPLLLFFIAFIFLAAINDGTGKFITDDDM